MKAHTSTLKKYEIFGAIFIIVFGSLLHFSYEWTGYWKPVALFAAVNESVWEHLKLAFWPALFWAFLESRLLPDHKSYFWASKAYAFAVPAIVIILVFYSYTSLLGHNYLILDICLFIAAIIAAQITSYKLLARKIEGKLFVYWGLVLLLVQIIFYGCFTYFPPKNFLFIEESSGLKVIQAD